MRQHYLAPVTHMDSEFTFDYILTKFKAVSRSLDAIREVATKIFNAIIRIELEIKENSRDLRNLEES